MEQQKNTRSPKKRKGEFGRSPTNPVLARSREEAYRYLDLLQKGPHDVRVEQQPDTVDGLLHFKLYRAGYKRERNLYFNPRSPITSARWPDGFCFKSCFRMYSADTPINRALIEKIAAQPLPCRPKDAASFDYIKELGGAAVRLLRWQELCSYAEGDMRPSLERLGTQLYDLDCQRIALYALGGKQSAPPLGWPEWSAKFRRHSAMLDRVRQANSWCFQSESLPDELRVFASEVLNEYILAEL